MKTQVKGLSIRQNITEHFRDAILTQKLGEGERLPSTQEIAKCFGTREANVQRAIAVLTREGLVTRRPRVGTIVTGPKKEFKRVAVYFYGDCRESGYSYYRRILEYVEMELKEFGAECLPVFENSENAGLEYLRELAEKQQIQGIIAPVLSDEGLTAVKSMNSPFVCGRNAGTNSCVVFDSKSFIEKSFDALEELKCENVALLTLIAESSPMNDVKDAAARRYHKLIDQAVRKRGMRILPEWRVCAPSNPELSVEEFGRFAFEGFKRIWASRKKPDGLLVHTDDLIQGVLLALLQAKVSVPDDLKLVMHHNKELPLICPVPCAFIENSIQELAKEYVKMVKSLYDGKTVKSVSVTYKRRFHPGD